MRLSQLLDTQLQEIQSKDIGERVKFIISVVAY